MKIRLLARPNFSTGSIATAMAVGLQAPAELAISRRFRWTRAVLMVWLCCVAWATAGVVVARFGKLAIVRGRFIRTDSIVAVRQRHAPTAGPIRYSTEVVLTDGRTMALYCNAIDASEALGVSVIYG